MAREDRITYHAVLAYRELEGGWIADEPWSGPSAASVKAKAAALSGVRSYVVAFSRTGDPQLGDFEPPVVLAEFGSPPPLNDERSIW